MAHAPNVLGLGASAVRRLIYVTGVVQAVGFRPFVYRAATRLGLSGSVRNTSAGATIEVEGPAPAIVQFLRELRESPLPSEIRGLEIHDLAPTGVPGFAIFESTTAAQRDLALVPADLATCADCWREFHDPNDRRFGYPFINCTGCGPRYTIIQDTPYDRRTTTMSRFPMCSECRHEYTDPRDRRFHAEPNACAACGPGVALIVKNGAPSYVTGTEALETMREARKLLAAGGILAVRGVGGFHLVCDAMNGRAVHRLRTRKRRSDKPFALMAINLESARRLAQFSPPECEILLSPERPIVIAERHESVFVAESVAPANRTLGIMLPYTPLQHLLFADPGAAESEFVALVMTSGNHGEEPIVTQNDEAVERLAGIADAFVLHNRDIHMRGDDSVAFSAAGRLRVLRRSRGYAPQSIDLDRDTPPLLACGAQLKHTFCLTHGRHAILSQHMGDLENYETLVFFQESLANLKRLFRIDPVAVAYDLHPHYLSTRFAHEYPAARRIGVQHHHAHIASCMAENGVRERVIGVAFDGTGFGTDRRIWGGEFLIADLAGFDRAGHFRYVTLQGSDTAVRQPWRAALAYLTDTFGENIPEEVLPSGITERQRKLAVQAAGRGINTVLTSSCGRLFDAVASILGIRQEVSFEGQAAIELEQIVSGGTDEAYGFEISQGLPLEIDFRAAIGTIVADRRAGVDIGRISARFHNTILECILQVCIQLRTAKTLNRVCLSGGTFQNRYLLERSRARLETAGFEVLLHSRVPANDGGISLGQAAIAGEILRREN